MYIIGLDYGNYYSQPVVIMGMDPATRRGGTPMDLCDPSALDPNGIPTAFFCSARRNNGEPLVGYEATKARPVANIVRYLKREMGKTVLLDGVAYQVDDMITATIQHCVRIANEQLYARTQQTTNKIGLSYPVTLGDDQRKKLIRLAEAATLVDGRHLEVVGTVTEPAASALDYQATHPQTEDELCVMAYDLGAGTFDLSVVVAFANGKTHADGSTYYYDAIGSGGIGDLGGKEFDQVMYDLIVKKMGIEPTGNQRDRLMQLAEANKRGLTTSETVYIPFETPDGDVLEAEITREEFNREARPLVMRTAAEMKRMLDDPNIRDPQVILLTGGSSRMPIVQEVLEEQFPQYRGRILPYCPSKAIAQGAARFATVEQDQEIHRVLQQRTTLELGTVFIDSLGQRYIEMLIPQGTPIPYTSRELAGYTVYDTQSSLDFSLREATVTDPDRREPDRDYKKVIPFTYDLKRTPKEAGTPNLGAICQVTIDENNIVHLRAWEPGRKEETLISSDESVYKQW